MHEAKSNDERAGHERQTQIRHLNQVDLSRRWRMSPRTLERWRWLGRGPRYIKIGGHVVYRCVDIEAFEAAQTHGPEAPSTGYLEEQP